MMPVIYNSNLNDKTKIKLIAKQYGASCHNIVSFNSNYSDIYFVEVLKKAFSKMSLQGQTYINNSYFYQDKNNWWKDIYSKPTYYRLKKKYLSEFIHNVEETYAFFN